jgi:hypothetical protein
MAMIAITTSNSMSVNARRNAPPRLAKLHNIPSPSEKQEMRRKKVLAIGATGAGRAPGNGLEGAFGWGGSAQIASLNLQEYPAIFDLQRN